MAQPVSPICKSPVPCGGGTASGQAALAASGLPRDQALPQLTDWQGPGSIPCHGAGRGQGWGTHGPPTTWLLSGFLPGIVWIWPFLFEGRGKKSPG